MILMFVSTMDDSEEDDFPLFWFDKELEEDEDEEDSDS